MTREEAEKIAVVLGNAYSPAVDDICRMLNGAGLGYLWAMRGEMPPQFDAPPIGGPAMTFAELLPGDVVVVEIKS